MSLQTDVHVLKSMAEQYAIIDDKTGKDLCAVYARGDRRCRPMGWMPVSDLDRLYQNGHLKRIRKGYGFSYVAERKLIEGGWSLSPDESNNDLTEEISYVPGHVQRSVRKRNGGYILRRLSKERGPNEQAFLSVHEIQAGELFQRDYARCYGQSGSSSQRFDLAHVDQTRTNKMETQTAAKIDASRAFDKAKAVLGAGLDQAALIICGEGKSLDVLEREQEWSRGSGRMILKLALQRLAQYYGTYPGERAKRERDALIASREG